MRVELVQRLEHEMPEGDPHRHTTERQECGADAKTKKGACDKAPRFGTTGPVAHNASLRKRSSDDGGATPLLWSIYDM